MQYCSILIAARHNTLVIRQFATLSAPSSYTIPHNPCYTGPIMPDDEKPKPAIRAIPRSIPPRLTLTRVALYCRVSTQMERQLNSLSAQMDFQRQDILDHPMWEYVDTYTDIGSGRSINSRPGFRRLMADCEAGKIDLIYTKSISRSGRNCVDFLMVLR
ncbi:MAG: recombinase family protein, partial [Bacteroidia bacterium]|nr:recombinase family protein [Bacteroidia bacterium]